MKKTNHRSTLFALLLIFAPINITNLYAQNQGQVQLQQMVYSIQGLSGNEQVQLIDLLNGQFRPIISQSSLNPKILKNTASIITALHFEQTTVETMADIAYKSYKAQNNGAPGVYTRDLAIIGIATKITAEQLEKAAKSIAKMMDAGIDPMVTEEIISYALYNGWNGVTIEKVTNGIIKGTGKNLPAKKLALTLIISIDQEIDQKSVEEIVNEAIAFLAEMEQAEPKKSELQKTAYTALQQAIGYGIPNSVATEIYYTAIEDKWNPETINAVYNGMITGVKKGLSAEKLGTALLIRFAQVDQITYPQKIVAEEIQYVASIEKKRTQMIQKDHKKYKRKPLPPNYSRLTYLQPKPTPRAKQPDSYFNSTNRTTLNQQLMWQNIQEYLGPPAVPYRWGGTSKSGIDCSGFVMNVYREQGIWLPRTSKQQYQVGKQVLSNLQFGDLLFFSKYGPAYQVTHVGIFIGGDKFVHSSASRGVTISSMNKRYYRTRLKGAKRITL